MRPLKLEFCGINSFSEHTIIDFEKLTSSGLFGIFGDTGSGKSTILDCINFALYGDVERSREKTDIINYRCDRATVKFVFDILTEGRRKTYTIDRTLKKDKNGTHTVKLYERDGNSEVCIAEKTGTVEKKIVEIIGTTDEDFRKCIALPQGEFSQFVKSAPAARLALIERLFSLYRYGDGLKEKLSKRQRETEDEYQNVSGTLLAYADVSEEALKELENKLKCGKNELAELTKSAQKAAKQYEEIKELAARRAELDEATEKLKGLSAEKQRIDKLKSELSVLPACREIVSVNVSIAEKLNAVKKLDTDLNSVAADLKRRTEEIKTLAAELKDGNYDEKIADCLKLSATFKSLQGKPEKLKSLQAELENRRGQFRIKEREGERLKEEVVAAENGVKELEESLKKLGSRDINGLFGAEIKGAVLKEEYAKNLDYFADFRGRLRNYEEDSPLYGFVDGELKDKIDEYRERVLAVKDFDKDALKTVLAKINDGDNERERLQNLLRDGRERLQKAVLAYELNGNEQKVLKRDGSELRARVDEAEAELKAALGDNLTDYAEAEKRNTALMKSLTDRKKDAEERTERAKNAERELAVTLERLSALKSAAITEAENLQKRLNERLSESGLNSVEDCKKIADGFADFADAENAVKQFDTKFSAVCERVKILRAIKGIGEVTADAAKVAEENKINAQSALQELNSSLAVVGSEYATAERRFNEKAEITKTFKELEKRRNLLSQLKDVLRNNKFLEFIANEYLCDISATASSTLLKLTDGRYYLTYKDNNFFAADNFDCGNLRGVNTMSGGEVFLVSLSLALALSQTICEKSMKNIEFFFLDEGFGTLDSTLVDTVMSALEKLKSSSFTIGVISHVEELKHRIDSKIIVNKATETHGSTVNVSC